MNKATLIGLTTLTVGIVSLPSPARADFGDVMLGVGVGAATGLVINKNNQRATEDRYKSVPPEQEYYRGVQDGVNGERYDNPRNSSDYDKGYDDGLKKRGQ
ncbi:hypothetical protein [Myxosarcina sp. GI1]|uniref:hypothetical protein n=1 Tax=Myxosarcina sp. GI1 TaxID=1541065 RepID=UPI00056D1CCD|nr:hypothetical protein [Myxosarcina sp. GI1]